MEIERNPQNMPTLNQKTIELLTKLCFREDDELEKVDSIFVFSSAHEIEKLSVLIEKLLSNNIAKNIFITGGETRDLLNQCDEIKSYKTEADLLLSKINQEKFKNINFFMERKSTNTLENVLETLQFENFKNSKSILFIFKSHAAGRGYLTLKRFFPNVKILQKTINTKFRKSPLEITKNNWHTFQFGIQRVWGEYLRIIKYGLRGDIEYETAKNIIEQIEEEIITTNQIENTTTFGAN
jgi:predicted solute-binding protein